jgi:hypothetical protein
MAMALGCLFHYLLSRKKAGLMSFWKHPQSLTLLYLAVSFLLATAAFYILARFRVPAVPLLAIGAGGFAGVLTVEIRRRDRRKIVMHSILPLLLGLFIVFSAYDIYRYSFESQVMRIVRPYGIRSELQGNKILYMDNGPLSFGSWTPFELKEGQVIGKKFSLKDSPDGKIAKFAIPFACEIPGRIKIEINGVPQTFDLKHGMNEKIFETHINASEPQIVIKTLYLDCKAHLILDHQRDYGRTEIDGEKIPAELVAKLYLEPANK